MDQAGNIALGFSTSSSTTKPSIRYTGRLAGDAAGTMTQGEGTIISGAGAQGSTLSRWGDYSSLQIDPVDDCTFWYTNEYIPANGTFNWKTRIASFKLPGCGAAATNDFSISATPTSVSVVQGASAPNVTISTAVTSGVAQTVNLTVSGVPANATASLSPTSVTAGGGSTLTFNAGTAALGTYTLTITGTGSSATHSTTVQVTITSQTPPPPADFTVAVSPASASVAAGSSTSYTVSTTAVNGSTQSIALSVSGLPSGVTGSFSPATVTAGGSSTLTISATTTATAGTTTFSATGTSGSTSHSASASITVTTGPATLTDGVPVTNISGATGSNQFWVMNVPAGKDTLTVTISGGSGDADLYVRFGSAPTTATFDCRPFISGNNETCTFNAPAAGSYFVMVRGFSAYSGVTLTGRTATTTALTSGVPVTGISGASGSQQFWKLAVPAGKTSLTVTISGGTGDADLYVRLGAKPTTSTFTCRPFLNGNNRPARSAIRRRATGT